MVLSGKNKRQLHLKESIRHLKTLKDTMKNKDFFTTTTTICLVFYYLVLLALIVFGSKS
jgi:hypothetical protein